jgi:hypothetical protein
MQANWGDRGIAGNTAAATGTGTEPTMTDDVSSALPDLKPWNQAGWIFLDGDCVAIARRDAEVEEPNRQARILAD